jgi:hypothetical protein
MVGHKDVQTTVSIYWDVKKSFQMGQLGIEDIKNDNNIFYQALTKSGRILDNTDFLRATPHNSP